MGGYHAIVGAGDERLGDTPIGRAAGHEAQPWDSIWAHREVACCVGLQVVYHSKLAWFWFDAGEGFYCRP